MGTLITENNPIAIGYLAGCCCAEYYYTVLHCTGCLSIGMHGDSFITRVLPIKQCGICIAE